MTADDHEITHDGIDLARLRNAGPAWAALVERLATAEATLAAVQALCDRARRDHQPHDIAPYVFVDEITDILAGKT